MAQELHGLHRYQGAELPPDYYHCFLGNGLDAVLIGPTGSMVAEKAWVDRCNWYKSDRYYPEHKLVQVAGRYPDGVKLEHAPESGWYELAPLGRTWYTVSLPSGIDGDEVGPAFELRASQGHFVPEDGTLYTTLEYGFGRDTVRGEAVTFLHAERSLLIERYTFDQEVDFTAWIGPGVWVEEGWDTDPFLSLAMADNAPEGVYSIAETSGVLALRLDLPAIAQGAQGRDRWVRVRGRQITKYFAIRDDRQGEGTVTAMKAAIEADIAPGYDALRTAHLAFWRAYFAASSVHLPDAQFGYFYRASLYHMKAMQNPTSGGLPVNNLRRTWSSHVFWDAYFLQRALLEANHRAEALESCRFFQRTMEAARRHAREEFGADGLKWDWEITHDGRKAYGTWLHQKFQIHNNASHANQILGYYAYTGDRDMLAEFFPILEGLATFYLNSVVQQSERDGRTVYEIGYQVGVHESAQKVRNDGINLAGTAAILRGCAEAAHILGRETEFTRRCGVVADALTETQAILYNGRFFRASEDEDKLNMSSVAPIYPMKNVAADDPRAISTARAYLARYEGRILGHGGSEGGFPWSAGVVAAIFALQGDGDTAWHIIESTRPTICNYGGMTELMQDGTWNMQYFGTAQGAVVTALHNLLLQAHPAADSSPGSLQITEIRLFPALPSAWHGETVSFDRLLAGGLEVSAEYSTAGVTCRVRHPGLAAGAPYPLHRVITYNGAQRTVSLSPGEDVQLTWQPT